MEHPSSPGTYQRTEGDENKSVEELKAASAAREIANRVEVAEREINAAIERSSELTNDAEDMHAEARKMRADASAKHAAVERQINDMLGESYIARTVASDGSLRDELDLDMGRLARVPGLRAIERELAEKRREVGDLGARDDALNAREMTVAARENAIEPRERKLANAEANVAARSKDASAKAERAEAREQRAGEVIEQAERLVARFSETPPSASLPELESLGKAADRASYSRSKSAPVFSAIMDCANSLAAHVRSHLKSPELDAWARADTSVYGTPPDRQHAFVAELWAFEDVCRRRAGRDDDEASSWGSRARDARELSDILNGFKDPVLDAWVEGDGVHDRKADRDQTEADRAQDRARLIQGPRRRDTACELCRR